MRENEIHDRNLGGNMRLKRESLLKDFKIEEVYTIYQSNPYYFITTHNREAKKEDVEEDIRMPPSHVKKPKKYYEIIYLEEIPSGVLDYLEDFPKKKTIYIGLYMIRGDLHGQGLGRKIFEEIEKDFREKEFLKLRLAVIKENTVAFSFWKELHFREMERKIWREKSGLKKEVIIMEKNLEE